MENNVNLVDLYNATEKPTNLQFVGSSMDKSQGMDVKTEIMMKLFNEIYEERKKFKELVKNNPNDMDLGRQVRSMVS